MFDRIYYTGLNVCFILTLIFIMLKVGNIITWNWIWVLSPLWIPPFVTLGSVILASVIAIISFVVILPIVHIIDTILEK